MGCRGAFVGQKVAVRGNQKVKVPHLKPRVLNWYISVRARVLKREQTTTATRQPVLLFF
jgi:hypothetical protein